MPQKPSERIKEIFLDGDDGKEKFIEENFLKFIRAILDYLDEEWEKKNKLHE